MKCGVVASYLALDIEDLALILVELEDRQLIESCPPSGLRLNDIAALERLADGRETLAPSIGPDLCVHGKASAH